MFGKTFLSPQVKRIVIISNKHGIYELPHELPNDLRLRTLAFHIFFLIEYICFHHSRFTHYHLVTKHFILKLQPQHKEDKVRNYRVTNSSYETKLRKMT